MKPGRNDACPCGSGRKYKKCCLAADERAECEAIEARRMFDSGVGAGAFSADEDVPLSYGPEGGELHAIAWALADEGREPDADEVEVARAAANPDGIQVLLDAAEQAQMLGRKRLAAAYDRLLEIALEVLERRAALGLATAQMVFVAVEDDIRYGLQTPILRTRVRRRYDAARVRARAKIAGAEPNPDLDRVIERIRALREKTVARGCTEEEALAAAEKIAEWLDRYGLDMSEVDIAHAACEAAGIETGRKRAGAIDQCLPAIAEFCDCRAWIEEKDDGSLRHVFFGLPADVAGARGVYGLVEEALAVETAQFRKNGMWLRFDTGGRRSATGSFQFGFANGVAEKLRASVEVRRGARTGTGRDLVPLKSSRIDEELSALGLFFRAEERRGRRVLLDAYGAGKLASERFEWGDSIANA